MAWWAWMVLGFLLLVAELVSPGAFFFLFFGTSALAVGFLVLANVTGAAWVDWLLFSGLSVAQLVLLRGRLVARFRSRKVENVDEIVGERARVLETIAPGQTGKVELRGTTWNAENLGEEPLPAGETCVVESISALTLGVKRGAARPEFVKQEG